MSFLHQQTRTKNDPQNRLVELRNKKGETALHRASCVGKIPTLKVRDRFHRLFRSPEHFSPRSTLNIRQFLLDSNSDPFAVDLEGNSVFINLTRCGCIWGLHYVHSYLWWVSVRDFISFACCKTKITSQHSNTVYFQHHSRTNVKTSLLFFSYLLIHGNFSCVFDVIFPAQW